jgi:hypothetical protein
MLARDGFCLSLRVKPVRLVLPKPLSEQRDPEFITGIVSSPDVRQNLIDAVKDHGEAEL